jgi:hypothetical protein
MCIIGGSLALKIYTERNLEITNVDMFLVQKSKLGSNLIDDVILLQNLFPENKLVVKKKDNNIGQLDKDNDIITGVVTTKMNIYNLTDITYNFIMLDGFRTHHYDMQLPMFENLDIYWTGLWYIVNSDFPVMIECTSSFPRFIVLSKWDCFLAKSLNIIRTVNH